MQPKKRFRVGIDCRLLGKEHAGIGRYIENLLLEIPHTPLHTQFAWVFVFYSQHQWQQFLAETDRPDFFNSQKVCFASVRHYSLYEQLSMPTIFSRLKLDLLHVPHFNIPIRYQGKMVVTIHDLLWHEYQGTHVTTLPAWKYWVKHSLYKKIVAQAIKKADVVFVPTYTIKKTVTNYFPVSEKKILVTKEGIGQTFLTHTPKTREKNNHLVYVGSLYPHKNIGVVLQTLKELPEFSLDIVGSRNIFQDSVRQQVKEMSLKERVHFHGYLTDKELIQLLEKSFALVQPSLFEGFGLTGVEALAIGVPVIASDIPVFREIYQNKAIFFDPHDSQACVKAIKKLQENKILYHQLSNFTNEVRNEFSWNKMTEQVLESYLRVCSFATTLQHDTHF